MHKSQTGLWCWMALVPFLTPIIAAQAILNVPTDFETIGAAIAAASDGDFIIVEDGVYSGPGNIDLDPTGKSIVIRSQNGPGNCYIDCGNSARAFIIQSGESLDTIIGGFTVTHGYADTFGGAILSTNASPLIENCCFENNSAEYGAAIAVLNGNPQIDNCIFFNNRASQSGAGIFLANSTSSISSCRIAWNFARAGAGMYVCWFSNPIITNCLLDWNSAERGGGIGAEFIAFPNIRNSTIANNSGMGVFTDWGNFLAIDSIFSGNAPSEFETGEMDPAITYCCIPGGYPGEGNLADATMYAVGPHSDYYLDVPAMPLRNPCIDSGSELAENICWTVGADVICMDEFTTQADMTPDSGSVDIGCHYFADDEIRRMSSRFIGPEEQPASGDMVGLDLEVSNPGDITHVNLCLFVIMEQAGALWFWPAWTNEPDWLVLDVLPGKTSRIIMPAQAWSGSGPEWFGSRFYGALTDNTITEIRGEIGIYPYRFESLQ